VALTITDGNVRFRGKSGKHMLNLMISGRVTQSGPSDDRIVCSSRQTHIAPKDNIVPPVHA